MNNGDRTAMIEPGLFCSQLAAHGTEFFTGVPDSHLKSFCGWVTDHSRGNNTGEKNHIIAVNEGVALACGCHLATGEGSPGVYAKFRYRKRRRAGSILSKQAPSQRRPDGGQAGQSGVCMPIKDILELIPGENKQRRIK